MIETQIGDIHIKEGFELWAKLKSIYCRILMVRLLLAMLFGLCCLCSPSRCFADSPGTYTITSEQMTELEQQLTRLSENNQRLLSLLTESNQELTTASEQLQDSQAESEQLLGQLNESQQQIEQLQQQLAELRTESANARKSLETAQQELNDVRESWKKLEAKNNQLTAQRSLWEIIASALMVGFVVK